MSEGPVTSLPYRTIGMVARCLMRLAPPGERLFWAQEAEHTLREVCAEAYRREGGVGLVATAFAECLDLARAALRARLGRATPITAGHPSRPPRQKGRKGMQILIHDIRLGIRSLRTSPTASLVAILTLSLGIGINTAVFSVLDSLLIRPAPFQQPERLVEVWNSAEQSKVRYPRFKRALYQAWRSQTDLFDRVEGYEVESAIYAGPEGAQSVGASFVTPRLLSMLGVAPLAGRVFHDGDGREGTAAQVVISERFRREQLGSLVDVLGSTLTLNGRPHTIVGIMPASFHFPNRSQELWLPLDVDDPPAALRDSRIVAYARLAPGVGLAQAAESVGERGSRLSTSAGGPASVSAALMPVSQRGDSGSRQSLIVLGGAVMFLLLIVCANLANLSLSRTLARGRDFAVRSALGATRRDLIRETVVENLLVGVFGVAGGLVLATVVLQTTTGLIPDQMLFQSLNRIDLDLRALTFTIVAGLLTSLTFGLPPALLGSRPNIVGVLRHESRSSTGSSASRRLRSGLVVGEVTVAIVLLVGAALMVRSFLKLHALEPGFQSEGLVSVRVGFPSEPYAEPQVRDRFSADALAELRRLPGIRSATVGTVPPDAGSIRFSQLEFAGKPGELTEQLIVPTYNVWPDYFAVLRLPMVDGRTFTDDEPASSIIVSQSFARNYWPGQSAVGQQFRSEGSKTWLTVVGVATEVRQLSLDDSIGSFEWYQPQKTAPGAAAPVRSASPSPTIEYRTFVVRADDPVAAMPLLKQAIHRVDSRMVLWKTSVVDDLFTEAIARPRVVLVLLLVFSGVGLVLAAAGIYGVLSYLVSQRLREIGIRLALGASPEGMFKQIIWSGMSFTLAGLITGLVASYFLVRVMRSILFEVEPSDPIAVGAVSLLLLMTAVAACWRPARRAMSVDPVTLLRDQ